MAALLDSWPWDLGGVVIGGYVSAAYGKPRYSDDIDIVIPVNALKPVTAWLLKEGFQIEDLPEDLEQNYAGKTARFVRKDGITLDLLPGGVMDREAKIHIPESWIAEKPRRTRLLMQDASTRTEVPVVRPEAFWALKLQAGRRRDLGDLFAMCDEPVDLGEVVAIFRNLDSPSLRAKLQKVKASIELEKTKHDALASRASGSPTLPRNIKAWAKFQALAKRAIPF